MDIVRVEPKITSEEERIWKWDLKGDPEMIEEAKAMAEDVYNKILSLSDYMTFIGTLRDSRVKLGEFYNDQDFVDAVMVNRLTSHAEMVLETPGIHVAPDTHAVALQTQVIQYMEENTGIGPEQAFREVLDAADKYEAKHILNGITLPVNTINAIIREFDRIPVEGFSDHIEKIINSICITEALATDVPVQPLQNPRNGKFNIVVFRMPVDEYEYPLQASISYFVRCILQALYLEYNDLQRDGYVDSFIEKADLPELNALDEEALMSAILDIMTDGFFHMYGEDEADEWLSDFAVMPVEKRKLIHGLIAAIASEVVNRVKQ